MKFKTTLLILTVAAAPVFASNEAQSAAAKVVPLKGGETLYVFKDGRMAKESKFGTAVYLQSGEVLESTDGQKISAVGNEVARLSSLLKKDHRN